MEAAGNVTNWTSAAAVQGNQPKVDRHRSAYKHHRRQAAVLAGRRRTARLSGAATKMLYLDGVNGVLDGVKRKISARFEIHKDDTEAVLPISKVSPSEVLWYIEYYQIILRRGFPLYKFS